MNTKTLSLFGLGKLGLCLASLHAKAGRKVIAVDILDNVVCAINTGISPIIEPDLAELVAEVGGKNLIATKDASLAVSESDISIILTATPSMEDGSFSNCQVESALLAIAKALRESKKPYHLFVISSTVMPGSLEGSFIPLIEQHSNRKLHKGFDICYLPDFVALGSVIHDFRNPDLVVIGESSEKAGELVAMIHKSICTNTPPIHRMSLASAEIAKVSLNAFITLKISFANCIGNICDTIPSANPDDITKALGCDKRISPYYFKAGLSFGGTCFPRDTWAFTKLLQTQKLNTSLMEGCVAINRYQDKKLAEKTRSLAKQMHETTIAIIGLAFKPNSPVIVESPAIKLIETLLANGFTLFVFDELAIEATKKIFSTAIFYASSVQECFDAARCCVLTLPSKSLVAQIQKALPQKETKILDPWRVLEPSLNTHFDIVR